MIFRRSSPARAEKANGPPLGTAGDVELRDVGMTYGAGAEAREVVSNCSFTIEQGRFTVMIGPSGAGKSTLIRLIAGFERPTRGTITIGGRPISKPGA